MWHIDFACVRMRFEAGFLSASTALNHVIENKNQRKVYTKCLTETANYDIVELSEGEENLPSNIGNG